MNLINMKKESFAIMHWMKHHSLETTAPDFAFKKVSSHTYALSRQLKEVLLIMEQGTMNKREEFSNNEIVRMDSYTYTWDRKKQHAAEERDAMYTDSSLTNFCVVMQNVSKKELLRISSNFQILSDQIKDLEVLERKRQEPLGRDRE